MVTDITEPTSAASSEPTEITWQVTNTGTGATSAGVWYDLVYLSTDTILDGADYFLGQVENPAFLAAGDKSDELPAGQYLVIQPTAVGIVRVWITNGTVSP